MSYTKVSEALKAGADPAMLCRTCPWDRYCVTPPEMTAQDVEDQINKLHRDDEERIAKAKASGENPGLPIGMLLGALTFGGKDTSAQVCPVFAMRLRTSDGRRIVDGIKAGQLAIAEGVPESMP